MKIATHNAKFHTDDVFAVAALTILYPDAEIIRTRDEELLKTVDIVVDVGEVYDRENNRFDHHQKGGAGEGKNGIPYSSFGLVWEKFGDDVCGSKEIADKIDDMLVQDIDAGDNGVDTFTPKIDGVRPALIHSVVNQYRLTWKEEGSWDKKFDEAVIWARDFLKRLIKVQGDILTGEKIVDEVYHRAEDKRIIIIDEKYALGRELVGHVLEKLPEVIYAVLFRRDHQTWQVLSIRKDSNTFETRKPLPVSWRAKHDKELDEATGVSGGVFCHRNGFMCVIKSKEGAVALAKKALEA